MNDSAPVLIGYDGSDDAKAAIAHAGSLFRGRAAIVLAVWQRAYAAPHLAMVGFSSSPDLSALDETNENVAAALAGEGTELAQSAGLDASPVVACATGPVSEAILNAAAEHRAVAVVLGSRGLGGLKSMLLGSVSRHVLHHAIRPTFVVRHTAGEPAANAPVVLCYDGSEDAKRAIADAGELFGARPAVVVVGWQRAHAGAGYGWGGAVYMPDLEQLDRAASAAAANVAIEGAALAEAAGFMAEPVVVSALGSLWTVLAEAAETRGAAAIVLGSRGLSGIKSALLGSVSNSVLHHTTRPVLVVRHGAGVRASEHVTADTVEA